jgi:hypothetical protein
VVLCRIPRSLKTIYEKSSVDMSKRLTGQNVGEDRETPGQSNEDDKDENDNKKSSRRRELDAIQLR